MSLPPLDLTVADLQAAARPGQWDPENPAKPFQALLVALLTDLAAQRTGTVDALAGKQAAGSYATTGALAALQSVVDGKATPAQITTATAALKDDLLGGAGGAYDTLAELKALLDAAQAGDATSLAALLTAVNARVPLADLSDPASAARVALDGAYAPATGIAKAALSAPVQASLAKADAAAAATNVADSLVAASAIPRWYALTWSPGTKPFQREPDTTWLPPAFASEEDVLACGGRLAYSWAAYYNQATTKAALVAGPFPSVPGFTGSSQGAYPVFPLDGVLEPTGFTAEFWVKSIGADLTAQAFTTAYTFLAFDGTGAQTEGLFIRRTAAGTLAAALSGGTTITASLAVVAGDVPADTWTALSVTYDGTTLRLTLGANAKSATATGSPVVGSLGSSEHQLGGLLVNPGTGGTTLGTAGTPAAAFAVTAPHVRRYPRTAGAGSVAYHPGVLVDATIPGASFRRNLTGIFSQYYGWKDALPDGSGGMGTAIRDQAITASAGAPVVRIDHIFDKITITDNGTGATPRYTYDWSAVDTPMDKWVAANPDVQFVITFGYTPALLGATRSTPPSDNALFAQMCTDAVTHWLAKGYKMAALSFWNEPSLGVFWTGNQTTFQALWVAVAQRLVTDHGTNALVPKLGTPDDIGTFSYQNGVLTAAQAAGLTVGSYHVHDYSGHPRNYRTNVATARTQLTTAGMPGVGVWVTEWNDNQNVLEQAYTAPLSLSTRVPDRTRQLRHASLCVATIHELAAAGAVGATFTRLGIIDDAYAGIERTLGAMTADDPPRPLPAHAGLSALWKLKGASVPTVVTSPALRALATWDAAGKVLTAVLTAHAPVRTGRPAEKVAVQWMNLPPAFTWRMWRFTEPDVADGRLRLVAAGDQTNLPLGVDLGAAGLYVVQVTSPTALPAFELDSLPGLRMAFKASSLTGLADGAGIETWTDTGPAGTALTQATAGKRPTKATANGRTVARFTSASAQTLVASYGADPLGTGPYTVLAVVNSANSDGIFSQMRASGNGTPIKGYFRGVNLRTIQRNDANTLISPASSVTNNGVWEVVSLVFDGSTLALRVNGRLASSTAHTGPITTNRLWLGSDQDSGQYLSGDIDSWRAYNLAMDATTLRHAEQKLAADAAGHGITIA